MSNKQPNTRNWQAVNAQFRKAGAMGGNSRERNRRERKLSRQELLDELADEMHELHQELQLDEEQR